MRLDRLLDAPESRVDGLPVATQPSGRYGRPRSLSGSAESTRYRTPSSQLPQTSLSSHRGQRSLRHVVARMSTHRHASWLGRVFERRCATRRDQAPTIGFERRITSVLPERYQNRWTAARNRDRSQASRSDLERSSRPTSSASQNVSGSRLSVSAGQLHRGIQNARRIVARAPWPIRTEGPAARSRPTCRCPALAPARKDAGRSGSSAALYVRRRCAQRSGQVGDHRLGRAGRP
jgi:hypothetical protein